MQKVQAQPGEAPLRGPDGELLRNPDGSLVLGHVADRWVGTGRTVFDNKGNVIRQYEPFFSSTSAYEDEDDLVEWGVTPLFHYDPIGRLICTQLPDGTERRVEFDAWRQEAWDENDAIEGTRWLAERLALLPGPERRAAELALEHANTPTVSHFDPLGRPYRLIEDNSPAGQYETLTELDIQGNPLRVIDAREVVAEDRALDMLGRTLHLLSPDSGETWPSPTTSTLPFGAGMAGALPPAGTTIWPSGRPTSTCSHREEIGRLQSTSSTASSTPSPWQGTSAARSTSTSTGRVFCKTSPTTSTATPATPHGSSPSTRQRRQIGSHFNPERL